MSMRSLSLFSKPDNVIENNLNNLHTSRTSKSLKNACYYFVGNISNDYNDIFTAISVSLLDTFIHKERSRQIERVIKSLRIYYKIPHKSTESQRLITPHQQLLLWLNESPAQLVQALSVILQKVVMAVWLENPTKYVYALSLRASELQKKTTTNSSKKCIWDLESVLAALTQSWQLPFIWIEQRDNREGLDLKRKLDPENAYNNFINPWVCIKTQNLVFENKSRCYIFSYVENQPYFQQIRLLTQSSWKVNDLKSDNASDTFECNDARMLDKVKVKQYFIEDFNMAYQQLKELSELRELSELGELSKLHLNNQSNIKTDKDYFVSLYLKSLKLVNKYHNLPCAIMYRKDEFFSQLGLEVPHITISENIYSNYYSQLFVNSLIIAIAKNIAICVESEFSNSNKLSHSRDYFIRNLIKNLTEHIIAINKHAHELAPEFKQVLVGS